MWVLNLKDGPLVESILKYILCCIFYLTFKYMIYLNFLALHAQGFHGRDTKIERGKHVIVGLQERKIPASTTKSSGLTAVVVHVGTHFC